MLYISVLDYNDGKVYQYQVTGAYGDIANYIDGHIESILEAQGHKFDDCYYMISEESGVEEEILEI